MKFALQALELGVKLGITSGERDDPQMVLADLDYQYDPAKAIESDDVKDTLNYQKVYDWVKEFVEGKEWDLLETFHFEMKASLEAEFKDMKQLELTLTKFPFEDGAVVVKG